MPWGRFFRRNWFMPAPMAPEVTITTCLPALRRPAISPARRLRFLGSMPLTGSKDSEVPIFTTTRLTPFRPARTLLRDVLIFLSPDSDAVPLLGARFAQGPGDA